MYIQFTSREMRMIAFSPRIPIRQKEADCRTGENSQMSIRGQSNVAANKDFSRPSLITVQIAGDNGWPWYTACATEARQRYRGDKNE
jgi:hypothetical protein